jgi:hypothetical protein
MDAVDDVHDAPERLNRLLREVREVHEDPAVEVFTHDALARLAALAGDTSTATKLSRAADSRMAAASHLITELDRTDARWVRALT